MRTKYGKEIKVGCILQSTKFGHQGVRLTCTHVGEHQISMVTPNKDMTMQAAPIVLTQHDLNHSYWDVVEYPSEK